MGIHSKPRSFPYQTTRIGPQPPRYHFPIQCSRCNREKDFESARVLPDEIVAKKLTSWGWLLGRNRSFDICPSCLGVKPENKLADKYKVTHENKPVLTPGEIAEQMFVQKENRRKETSDLLTRLLSPTAAAPTEELSPSPAMDNDLMYALIKGMYESMHKAILEVRDEIARVNSRIDTGLQEHQTIISASELVMDHVSRLKNKSSVITNRRRH
jgi:hypothetical protein